MTGVVYMTTVPHVACLTFMNHLRDLHDLHDLPGPGLVWLAWSVSPTWSPWLEPNHWHAWPAWPACVKCVTCMTWVICVWCMIVMTNITYMTSLMHVTHPEWPLWSTGLPWCGVFKILKNPLNQFVGVAYEDWRWSHLLSNTIISEKWRRSFITKRVSRQERHHFNQINIHIAMYLRNRLHPP